MQALEPAPIGHLSMLQRVRAFLGVVAPLVAAGASVEARKGEQGMKPLHAAASNGHADVVESLIAAGAEVDARDVDGGTSLFYSGYARIHGCYGISHSGGRDS